MGVVNGIAALRNSAVSVLAASGVEGGVELGEVANAAVGMGGRVVGELQALAVNPDAVDSAPCPPPMSA